MTNDTQISDRELEILRLVATGATNQQIAQQLNISINTVKVHLRNIFGKIGVVSRTEATVYAIRNGLVPGIAAPPEPPAADAEPAPVAQVAAPPPPPVATPPQASVAVPPSPQPTASPSTASPPPQTIPSPVATPPLPQAAPAPAARRVPLLWIGVGLAFALVAAALIWRLGGAAEPRAAAPTAAPADESERWSTHAPLPRPRAGFALAAFEPEGRLFVIGGSQDGLPVGLLDRYDPQSGRWVSLDDKPTPVSEAGAISLRGRLYVPGGEGADGRPTAAFEAYDPQERRWQQLAPLPAPRSRYALAVWEGRIFLIGGWDGAALSDEVFVYDPEADRWSEAGALPEPPRQRAAATVVAGRLYLTGGEGPAGPLSEVLRLDPGEASGGRWERLAQLPAPVARPSAITVINSLLVVDAATPAAWQYDASADAWTPYPIVEGAPVASRAALLGTSIYFVSDESADSPKAGAVGEYQAIFTSFFPVRGVQSPAYP